LKAPLVLVAFWADIVIGMCSASEAKHGELVVVLGRLEEQM